MRPKTDQFTVNGKPLLVPDTLSVSYEDLDAADAGRDQSGLLHRSVVRYKVGAWSLSYGLLTQEEKDYLDSLFPDEPTFTFGHPARTDATAAAYSTCYRSKWGISWFNVRRGLWSGLSFHIIEV